MITLLQSKFSQSLVVIEHEMKTTSTFIDRNVNLFKKKICCFSLV